MRISGGTVSKRIPTLRVEPSSERESYVSFNTCYTFTIMLYRVPE
jgi:hypothetical protein